VRLRLNFGIAAADSKAPAIQRVPGNTGAGEYRGCFLWSSGSLGETNLFA